eukprot:TRINITY_DN5004_c2_g1_i3.p1 TRINITY_DN5004_c2_g1~~TRINITY_DN5004_c2_g1_i3.p1  ORF type:complete len:253 (-),score=57.75 TRINITY_DN5004_c2_g1_i3:820-1578(-)
MASSLGFNDQDIKDALKKFVDTNRIKLVEGEEDKFLWICKKYFDGYNLFQSDTHIYIPQLICKFIQRYFSEDRIRNLADQLYSKKDVGDIENKQGYDFINVEIKFIKEMDDPNLRISSGVIQKLAIDPSYQQIFDQLICSDNYEPPKVHRYILTNPPKFSEHVRTYANDEFVNSFLYHAGYTTIVDTNPNLMEISFKIPNKIIAYNYFEELLGLMGKYATPSQIFRKFLQNPSKENLGSFFEIFHFTREHKH